MDNLDVGTLGALSADLRTVTAGRIRNKNGKVELDIKMVASNLQMGIILVLAFIMAC